MERTVIGGFISSRPEPEKSVLPCWGRKKSSEEGKRYPEGP